MPQPECADRELDNRRGFGERVLWAKTRPNFGCRFWEQKLGSEEATDEAKQYSAWAGGDFEEWAIGCDEVEVDRMTEVDGVKANK